MVDITYIPTGEGWLYLVVVEDLHSQGGCSGGERSNSHLVVDAAETAVSRRLNAEGLLARSDRGSQYTSEHSRRILSDHQITGSISRRANC